MLQRVAVRLAMSALVTAMVACDVEPRSGDAPTEVDPTPAATGELSGLPVGREQWARVCATGSRDQVTTAFCIYDHPPGIGSLRELQENLGFAGGLAFLTGMSTGVGLRRVTPLNPRAILIRSGSTAAGSSSTCARSATTRVSIRRRRARDSTSTRSTSFHAT